MSYSIADNYEVDFVVDGSADPTGVADCGPAWTRCGALMTTLAANPLLSVKSLVLRIPPGVFLHTTAASISFGAGINACHIIIEGEGDSSILLMNVGGASNAISVANIGQIDWKNFTVIGKTNSAVVADCNYGIVSFSGFRSTFYCVNVYYLLSTTAGLFAGGDSARVDFDLCFCGNSGVLAGGKAVFYANAQSFSANKFQTFDLFIFQGLVQSVQKDQAAGTGFLRFDAFAGPLASSVDLNQCFFGDEQGEGPNLVIMGDPSAPIPYVRIDGLNINPPAGFAGGDRVSCHIENVVDLYVRGYVATGFNVGVNGAAIEMVNVFSADIQIRVNNASASNFITADAACGTIEVRDSPTLTTPNIQSLAARTFVTLNGVRSAVKTTASAVVAGQLVRNTSAGPVALLVTDTVSAVGGVSVETAGSGVLFREALPAQTVTMLSDGTGVIEVGDLVVPSPTSAGRVRKNRVNGAPTVGTVTTPNTTLAADSPAGVIWLPQQDSQFYAGEIASIIAWWSIDQPGPGAVVAGKVATWADLISAIPIAQGTAGNRPAFSATGGSGGLPAAQFLFSSLTQSLQSGAAALTLAAPFEYFFVGKSSATPAGGNAVIVDFGVNNALLFILLNTDSLSYFNAGLGPQVTITENVPFIADIQVGTTSTTMVVRQNGATTTVTASIVTGAITGTVTAGNAGGGGEAFGGDYQALLVSNAILSAGNRAKVMAMLQQEWSIP